MIEYSFERNERMGWSTHIIKADGSVVCGITDQTPINLVHKFVELCEENDGSLCELCFAADERREWNHKNPGRGKDWPAFRLKEKFVDMLLAKAGIKNT